MRNYLMTASLAVILPALSACSYLPSFGKHNSNVGHDKGYQSYGYEASQDTGYQSHDLDYNQVATQHSYSTEGHASNSYNQQDRHSQHVQHTTSYNSGCDGVAYAQAQPCSIGLAPSHSYQAQSPSMLVAQGDLNCNNVGCAPSHSYSVSGNNYHPPKLRGSYDSHYIYGNLGGQVYDAGQNTFAAVARLGYQSPYYVGAEVEGSLGVNNMTIQDGTDTIKGGPDYSVAAFALARLPLGDKFSVHARGGYHVTRVSAELDNGTTVIRNGEAFDGFAYGAGAEFNMSPRDSIRVDYTRYEYDAQNVTIANVDPQDTASIAYARKF